MNRAPEAFSVSVTLLSQMFIYLSSVNVDVDKFLLSFGVDPGLLKSPDARVPVDTYTMIQDEAARFTGDPCFGLHVGEYAEIGSWSILGYMMMNCRTLGEAFEKSNRYSRIIGNLIEARAEPGLSKIKIVFFTPPHAPELSRHCIETAFSTTMRMTRNLTGKNLYPREITFSHPAPESTEEYQRIFHCPVLFERKENSYSIDWDMIHTPVLMANPELLAYFEDYARDFLIELDHPKQQTRAVAKILLSCLDDETLTIDKVAKTMSVSVRTLQNRLAEEGVVFSDLLREIRERLAKKYLRENYTVEQITYMLGFSEPSVFRKAFKKWSGITPGEYRESQLSRKTTL